MLAWERKKLAYKFESFKSFCRLKALSYKRVGDWDLLVFTVMSEFYYKNKAGKIEMTWISNVKDSWWKCR